MPRRAASESVQSTGRGQVDDHMQMNSHLSETLGRANPLEISKVHFCRSFDAAVRLCRVRVAADAGMYAWARARQRARNFWLKLRKLRKWDPGMSLKLAKVARVSAPAKAAKANDMPDPYLPPVRSPSLVS